MPSNGSMLSHREQEAGLELAEQFVEDRARAVLAMSLASYALDVPLTSVPTRRDVRAALARQVAMYVAHVVFGMSMERVGAAFGRDRSTVSYACRAMEDRRDDARFDRWIDALERSAQAAPAPFEGARNEA